MHSRHGYVLWVAIIEYALILRCASFNQAGYVNMTRASGELIGDVNITLQPTGYRPRFILQFHVIRVMINFCIPFSKNAH